MDPHDRKVLRERFLAQQQQKLAEDARLDDPARAYRQLLAELARDKEEQEEALLPREQAA